MSQNIALGLYLAHKLGIPLKINGVAVDVPAELCPERPATPDLPGEPGEFVVPLTAAPPGVDARTYRLVQAVMLAIETARVSIEQLGRRVGLEPQRTEIARPALSALHQPAEPEPPEPPVVEVKGEWHVGDPAIMSVRSNGDSWYVVRLRDNTLQSWHTSRAAALAWAIAAVKDPFTTPRPAAQEQL